MAAGRMLILLICLCLPVHFLMLSKYADPVNLFFPFRPLIFIPVFFYSSYLFYNLVVDEDVKKPNKPTKPTFIFIRIIIIFYRSRALIPSRFFLIFLRNALKSGGPTPCCAEASPYLWADTNCKKDTATCTSNYFFPFPCKGALNTYGR